MEDSHTSHIVAADYSAYEARILASLGMACEFCAPCGEMVICKDLLSHYRSRRQDKAHLMAEIMES